MIGLSAASVPSMKIRKITLGYPAAPARIQLQTRLVDADPCHKRIVFRLEFVQQVRWRRRPTPLAYVTPRSTSGFLSNDRSVCGGGKVGPWSYHSLQPSMFCLIGFKSEMDTCDSAAAAAGGSNIPCSPGSPVVRRGTPWPADGRTGSRNLLVGNGRLFRLRVAPLQFQFQLEWSRGRITRRTRRTDKAELQEDQHGPHAAVCSHYLVPTQNN